MQLANIAYATSLSVHEYAMTSIERIEKGEAVLFWQGNATMCLGVEKVSVETLINLGRSGWQICKTKAKALSKLRNQANEAMACWN